MSESADGMDALRARVAAAGGDAADARALAEAARARLAEVLELIASGRGVREAGSGLNAASAELLVADALLTEAAADAATTEGGLDHVLRALDLDALSERARAIDEGAG
ncbi:MAG TPA: hypothetical protein VMN78_11000 [Longimicrobiales bacterium]|nr:hypothetical protein [Longimicrobiales bacterium]